MRAQKSATRGIALFFEFSLGLVIHPYETTTSDAVFPKRPRHHTRAAISDLRSAILTVISVTVGIFLTPYSLVFTAVNVLAPHPATFVLYLLCGNCTFRRQPEKRQGGQHHKYCNFFHLILSPYEFGFTSARWMATNICPLH